MSRVAMWKPPTRREYQPKPMDPGQVIVWTVRIPSRWTVPPRYDNGTYTEGIGWVEAVEYERIGTIWSVATSASSWWVVPDDEDPEPVIVRRAGKSYKHHFPEGTLYQSGECSDWREGIRRAENVRKRGVYAVLTEETREQRGYYGGHWRNFGSRVHSVTRYHADPDCPEAEGMPRVTGRDLSGESWDVWRIADVLVGRVHLPSPPPFCPRCIMLEPAPETARELVTA